MTLTVRLDPAMEELVKRLSRTRGRSRSAVVREALGLLAEREAARAEAAPYEAIKHLVGCVDSGGAQLSERTGARFRELLETRKRARDPR